MLLPSTVADELLESARFHRIAPLIHVMHRETSPDVAELCAPDRMRAITGHLQACGALHQLGKALGEVAWVAFKGPVFSEHAHPVPGLRSYNDVDVLVAPTQLREVTQRLSAAGWRVVDYADMLRNEAVPGEMHWLSPGGVLVDLHWSMINMASRRRLFEVSTDDLLRRRVETRLGIQQVWTLEPVDALLHACLHAANSGAHKLLYLLDVDRLARAVPDWDAVATRARQWRAQAQVGLVLGRARAVMDTPVPPDLARRLGIGWPLRTLMRLTDRSAPVSRVRRDSGLAKFVARAVRPSGPATAAAIARNSLLWLAGHFGRSARQEGARTAADAESLEIYLAAVERAAALS